MATLPRVSASARLRARRWDAIILGSGLTALVTAARLGAAGQRVLVVEEERAKSVHPVLREPFFLAGMRDQGAVHTCLRELKIPLLDQRRIAPERLAYQIISPGLRLDVGAEDVTVDELVNWGICDLEEARALVRTLSEATEAERKVMLESPLVRTTRRLGLGRVGATGSHIRGLPAEAARPSAKLAPILDAQVSVLSNLAAAEVTAEARARLLGCGLAGGVGFGDESPWLLGLLRKRVEAVQGEFRSISGKFSLVSVENRPGIMPKDADQIWVGRILAISAATSPLCEMIENEEIPEFLSPERTRQRRIALHMRVDREFVPGGMCSRLIFLGDPKSKGFPGRVASLGAFASGGGKGQIDLVARFRVGDEENLEEAEAELEGRIRGLMPFSGDHLERVPQDRPAWDDDGWLEDPIPGSGWPSEINLKASGRPPIYRLDRSGVGSLGVEGDLLLGWRSGDAIAKELG